MKLNLLAAAAAIVVAATPAQAVITSITLTGGTAFTNGGTGLIVAQQGTFAPTGNNVRGFNELQNVVIGTGGLSPADLCSIRPV